MSEYFSDKDDQSFDMPNDDPAASEMKQNTTQMPEYDAGLDQKTDESGFGSTSEGTNAQQQDLVYMGIMALIIAVMLYILYSMFFAVASPNTEKIEPVKVETTVKPKPVEPVQVIAPVENMVAKLDPQDRQQIQKQSESITANEDKINEILEESHYMTTMVRKLGDAKENINKRFEDLESEIDRLVAATDEAHEKIALLEKKLAEKAKPKVKEKPKMTYTLQAVVEGRAWIETSKGRSMTVKAGDALEDYGVITKIDAVNSLVYTSSGKIIRVQ